MKKDALGPQVSTHEYLRGVSQSVLDQRDLTTPTSLEEILQKVASLRGWDIHGNRVGNKQFYPEFDDAFRAAIQDTLTLLTEGKDIATGGDLIRAYEQAVETTAPTLQARANMYQPLAYVRMINHFEIPVLPKLIGEMLLTNPLEAGDYKAQADRWASGIVGKSE